MLRQSYESGGEHARHLRNHFDLPRCVPMSREEERRCAREYVKTKAPVLAERHVIATMRMIVAHSHCCANNAMSDLVQEGSAASFAQPTSTIRRAGISRGMPEVYWYCLVGLLKTAGHFYRRP